MALVQCPECGKQVSDQAAACPECAYPIGGPPASVAVHSSRVISTKRAGGIWEAIGFLLIVAAVIAGLANNSAGSGPGLGSLLGVTGFIVFLVGRFK